MKADGVVFSSSTSEISRSQPIMSSVDHEVQDVAAQPNVSAAQNSTLNLNLTKQEDDVEQKVAKSTVESTVTKANSMMERTRCEFSYHENTHRVSIKVINRDTDEVIKEIPPEKSLEMLEKLWEMAGILVDEKR